MTAAARTGGARPSSHGAVHVFEYRLRVYARTWRGSLFSTFLSPVLFLTAMGVGLGSLVDTGNGGGLLGGVGYAAFLAPGLLAAQGMQTATNESTFTIMGGFVWDRTFHGMFATPITAAGIVAGQLAWVTARLALAAGVFFLVMIVFGLVVSPFALLGIAASMLTGLAFAAPIMAFAATQRDDQVFSAINRFLITPLFLFSGTFFPIEQLPAAMRPIAWLTPTWHGVELARGLVLGTLDPLGALVHIGVLAAFIAAGVAAALVTFRRSLEH